MEQENYGELIEKDPKFRAMSVVCFNSQQHFLFWGGGEIGHPVYPITQAHCPHSLVWV